MSNGFDRSKEDEIVHGIHTSSGLEGSSRRPRGHVQPLVAENRNRKTGWGPVPRPTSTLPPCPEAYSSSVCVVTSSLRSVALCTSGYRGSAASHVGAVPTFRSGEWQLPLTSIAPHPPCASFSIKMKTSP
jgi:hypothetical protein